MDSRKSGSVKGGRCPNCHSTWNTEFLELAEVGSMKYSGAIPQVAGIEKESRQLMAYYKCNRCNIVYYSKPAKGE
jgi:hypothetical protein